MRWASSPHSAASGSPASSGVSTPISHRPTVCGCRPADSVRQVHHTAWRKRAETSLFQMLTHICRRWRGAPAVISREFHPHQDRRSTGPGFLGVMCACLLVGSASASQPSWIDEFHDLCGQPDRATRLTKDELAARLARCDRLAGTIANGTHPGAKVYLFRLKKCRDFHQYLIDVDQATGGEE